MWGPTLIYECRPTEFTQHAQWRGLTVVQVSKQGCVATLGFTLYDASAPHKIVFLLLFQLFPACCYVAKICRSLFCGGPCSAEHAENALTCLCRLQKDNCICVLQCIAQLSIHYHSYKSSLNKPYFWYSDMVILPITSSYSYEGMMGDDGSGHWLVRTE